MAPKRLTPIEDPPSASSSAEEDEEGDETSSEEEEEEEPTPQVRKIQKPSSPPPKSHSKSDESDSDSDSESGSETDSDDERPNPNVKPIASKPMEEAASTPQKSNKSRSKPAAASPKPAKRGAETDGNAKDGKRAKKDPEADGGVEPGEKSKLFQRLWSEEDEITLLNGVIEFKAKKGVDPSRDMAGFFDFIRKDLHFDVSQVQLKDKVWRLKRKFEKHVKGKKGEDKTFSKEHDQKGFDLSKKIWGSEAKGSGSESVIQSNGKAKKVVNESTKKVLNETNKKQDGKDLNALKVELGLFPLEADEKVGKKESVEVDRLIGFGKFSGGGGMEEYVLSKGLELLEGSKRAEMEERLLKLHVEELELFLKRNELVKEVGQLLLAAYNKIDED